MLIDLEVARRLASAGVLDMVAGMVRDARIAGRREMKEECAKRVAWTHDAASKTLEQKEFNSVSHWLDQVGQRISEADDEGRDE